MRSRAPALENERHFTDGQDKVREPEAADETTYEKIVDDESEGWVGVKQRVKLPEAGPRHDREERSRLETVNDEENRDRHPRPL